MVGFNSVHNPSLATVCTNSSPFRLCHTPSLATRTSISEERSTTGNAAYEIGYAGKVRCGGGNRQWRETFIGHRVAGKIVGAQIHCTIVRAAQQQHLSRLIGTKRVSLRQIGQRILPRSQIERQQACAAWRAIVCGPTRGVPIGIQCGSLDIGIPKRFKGQLVAPHLLHEQRIVQPNVAPMDAVRVDRANPATGRAIPIEHIAVHRRDQLGYRVVQRLPVAFAQICIGFSLPIWAMRPGGQMSKQRVLARLHVVAKEIARLLQRIEPVANGRLASARDIRKAGGKLFPIRLIKNRLGGGVISCFARLCSFQPGTGRSCRKLQMPKSNW